MNQLGMTGGLVAQLPTHFGGTVGPNLAGQPEIQMDVTGGQLDRSTAQPCDRRKSRIGFLRYLTGRVDKKGGSAGHEESKQ